MVGLPSPLWKRRIFGGRLGRVAGRDFEEVRVPSVDSADSALECGKPRVGFACEVSQEL